MLFTGIRVEPARAHLGDERVPCAASLQSSTPITTLAKALANTLMKSTITARARSA